MTTRKLDKAQWKGFLERISKLLQGKQAEVEVASLKLGDQIVAEWTPILGIAYDPKDDLIDLDLDGLDHMIRHPRELYVENGLRIASLEIVDEEGVSKIVKFKDPMMFPAPQR